MKLLIHLHHIGFLPTTIPILKPKTPRSHFHAVTCLLYIGCFPSIQNETHSSWVHSRTTGTSNEATSTKPASSIAATKGSTVFQHVSS